MSNSVDRKSVGFKFMPESIDMLNECVRLINIDLKKFGTNTNKQELLEDLIKEKYDKLINKTTDKFVNQKIEDISGEKLYEFYDRFLKEKIDYVIYEVSKISKLVDISIKCNMRPLDDQIKEKAAKDNISQVEAEEKFYLWMNELLNNDGEITEMVQNWLNSKIEKDDNSNEISND